MAVKAIVREWHPEEGWGVVDAPQTPGGCWASFSNIAMTGYRELSALQSVMLEWEIGDQDGFSYRAVRVWPVGKEPVEISEQQNTTAYSSTLTLRFDEPD